MGVANIAQYRKIEQDIKSVGKQKLLFYIVNHGHRANLIDRDMKIIKYCLQHGPVATSKVFHLSESYPRVILKKYGDAARAIIKEEEKRKIMSDIDETPLCPVCRGEAYEFVLDINGEIVGCNNCISTRNAYEYSEEQAELEKDYHDELRWEIEREGMFTSGKK